MWKPPLVNNWELNKYLTMHPELTLEERGLAVCLARFRSVHTFECRPPIARIAETLPEYGDNHEKARTVVRRLVRALERKKILIKLGSESRYSPAQIWWLFDIDKAAIMVRNLDWYWFTSETRQKAMDEINQIQLIVGKKTSHGENLATEPIETSELSQNSHKQ